MFLLADGIVVASSSSVRQRIRPLGDPPKHKTMMGEQKTQFSMSFTCHTVDEMIYEKNVG
jgi:hypothetical protein